MLILQSAKKLDNVFVATFHHHAEKSHLWFKAKGISDKKN